MSARLQSAVFWLMVAGVLASALALAANRPVSWLALSAGAALLFAVQTVLDLGQSGAGRMALRLLPVSVLYLGVVGWAAIQAGPAPLDGLAYPAWADLAALDGDAERAAISADPGASWHGVLRYLAYACVFWIAARGASLERARLLIGVIAAFSATLAGYGLLAWAADVNPIVGEPAYPGMVTASFVNRNAYAFYAGVGAMCCLTALAFHLPARTPRDASARKAAMRDFIDMILASGWGYLLAFLILLAAVFLTGSRAGAAVSLLGIVMVIFMTYGRMGGLLRWISFGVLGLLVAALLLGANVLNKRMAENDPLRDQRFELYDRVVAGISDRPLTGHGLGAFQDAFRQYIPSGTKTLDAEWDLAHSSYLENAFELGLPAAFALFLAIALLALWIATGLARRRRMRPLLVLALAVLSAGALHSLIDFSLQMPATAALLALILGQSWALSRRDLTEGNETDIRKRRTKRAPLSEADGAQTPKATGTGEKPTAPDVSKIISNDTAPIR